MRKIILNSLFVVLFASCGGGSSSDPVVSNPVASTLVFPAQNSECTTGTNTAGATTSTIVFNWNNSANTDSYVVSLKNLTAGTTTTYPATTNQLSIVVSQGTPYSWSVTSKSNSVSATAVSDTWKFYAASSGIINYAPFPAEAVAPVNGAVISATGGIITLDWNATDIDSDIVSYDVYFSTQTIPSSFKTGLTDSILTGVSVNSGSTYYWYIITKDKQGNTSKSETFSFSVKNTL